MIKLVRGAAAGLLAVALDTWRLAWRDPLTRLELLLLLLLDLFSSIATVGSPTTGDGAIQMFAIAYAVTPFALVLLVGQIGRSLRAEVAWWSRPLSRESYYLGRFVGYLAVGTCIVAFSGAAGALLMAAIGGFPLAPSLVWNAWFAMATLPGLVTVAGGSLFLLQRTGPGIRYFTPAILISLALAFADYKWSAMAAALPHLVFWNPFPGFLTLGLALPPRLLGTPPVVGWIWINRLLYMGVGLLFLAGAIASRGRHGFRYPLERPRAIRLGAGAVLVGVAAVGLLLHATASASSPGNLAAGRGANRPVPGGRVAVAVSLVVDPHTGELRGRALYRHLPEGRIEFALNAGLTPESVREGGHALAARRVGAGLRVLPATAAALWSVRRTSELAGPLAITFRGTLLPQASTLPYPPFALGRVYESMQAGNGRLFLNGMGTWFPVVVARNARELRGIREGRLRLSLTEPTPKATTITDMHPLPNAQGWSGKIGRSAFLTAPYAVTALAFAESLSATPLSGASLSVAQLYAAAWRSLEAILSGPERTLVIVSSPVTDSAELLGNLLIASDLHPYQLPTDPVTGSAHADPTPERCLGELISLWWAEQAVPTVGLFSREATPLQAQARRVFAALDLLYLTPAGLRTRIVGDLKRGSLPGIGRLTPAEEAMAERLWPAVRPLSYGAWEALRASAARAIARRSATWAAVAGTLESSGSTSAAMLSAPGAGAPMLSARVGLKTPRAPGSARSRTRAHGA